MTPVRILIAAALAATGHAGASVLIALLTAGAWLIRAFVFLLPVLPWLALAGLIIALAVLAWLVFRSVKGWPHLYGVAVTST